MMEETTKHEEEKNKNNDEPWWLFNVADYESLMRPIIWLNAIVRFLRYETESSGYVSRKSRFSFYSITMIFGTVICLILSTYTVNFSGRIKDPSVIIHCNFILILSPIIVFECISSNDSTVRMIRKVANVSRLLSPATFRKLSTIIYMKDAFQLIPFLVYIPDMIRACEVILACTSSYTFLVVIVANALYVNNVYVLKACFEKINDSLEKMHEALTKDDPHLLRRMYRSQRNPVLLTELRNLKKQHLEVSNVVKLVNETNGIQNMGTILMLFIDITFNVYHHIVLFIQEGAFSIWFSGFNQYIIYHSFNIMVIVWVVESTRDQAQKIGFNIHRIVVNTFDEEMINELQLFSVQALQSDNTFTALGLPMDATILTKLICSITTNVLILIQFLFEKSC